MARSDRQHSKPPKVSRSAFQRDRDRILYSTEFRRLSGVTQVVSPIEGDVFHNRLTHTLKVAQIARRLAERFCDEDAEREEKDRLLPLWGGLDPDVVEAAALAHDLGHPPFGHIGEEEIDRLVKEAGARGELKIPDDLPLDVAKQSEVKALADKVEGYEGNAQSLRILTRLSVRKTDVDGLDLTRATLNATLKYPVDFVPGTKKYGYYKDDNVAFDFARKGTVQADRPSLEAQIMDWADDITNAVHDVDDFFRAGRIPLNTLRLRKEIRNEFVEWAYKRRKKKEKTKWLAIDDLETVKYIYGAFIESQYDIVEAFSGSKVQHERLAKICSDTIDSFVTNTTLRPFANDLESALEISNEVKTQVELAKDLIWHYVILNPALGAHQHGQRQAIRCIFSTLYTAVRGDGWYLFPPRFHKDAELLAGVWKEEAKREEQRRLVADAIASLTDMQALRFHQRLIASSQGSVMDQIIT